MSAFTQVWSVLYFGGVLLGVASAAVGAARCAAAGAVAAVMGAVWLIAGPWWAMPAAAIVLVALVVVCDWRRSTSADGPGGRR